MTTSSRLCGRDSPFGWWNTQQANHLCRLKHQSILKLSLLTRLFAWFIFFSTRLDTLSLKRLQTLLTLAKISERLRRSLKHAESLRRLASTTRETSIYLNVHFIFWEANFSPRQQSTDDKKERKRHKFQCNAFFSLLPSPDKQKWISSWVINDEREAEALVHSQPFTIMRLEIKSINWLQVDLENLQFKSLKANTLNNVWNSLFAPFALQSHAEETARVQGCIQYEGGNFPS